MRQIGDCVSGSNFAVRDELAAASSNLTNRLELLRPFDTEVQSVVDMTRFGFKHKQRGVRIEDDHPGRFSRL